MPYQPSQVIIPGAAGEFGVTANHRLIMMDSHDP